MQLPSLVLRAFSAGELAPSLSARADQALYQLGLKTCRNFLIQRQGGVINRPGTRFLGEVKDSADATLLYRWSFTAASQSTLIELGDQYARFWRGGERLEVVTADLDAYSGVTAYEQGDLVKDAGVGYYALRATTGDTPASSPADWYPLPATGANSIYEIPTPWLSTDFTGPTGRPRFAQDGATIVITHSGYEPRLLTNLDPTGIDDDEPSWTLSPIVFGPSIAAPANLAGTEGATGTAAPQYKVTAVKADTFEESLPTAAVTLSNAVEPPTEAAPNHLTWDAVADAVEYRVYKDPFGNGTFGLLERATEQEEFFDVGFAPDFSLTPPQAREPFGPAAHNPEVATHYQQRRVFAHTETDPATVWTSRTGFLSNLSIRSPLQDDDAVTFTISARDLHVVRHLVPLKQLVILTNTGEWLVRGNSDGVLTPTGINLDQHAYHGASRVVPVVIGNAIVYVQARGTSLRDLRFDAPSQSALGGRDLTLFAGHLVDGYTLTAIDYQLSPHSIVWVVRSDGTLLALTYLADVDQWGWSRCDSGGDVFEDVCVVPEDDEDVVYVLVRRTVDGSTVRYLERLASRPLFTDASYAADAFFVDCGITQTGASTTSVTGLDHLEGETVYALADGAVQGPFTVAAGAITLTTAASTVHVGLRITAQLETLPLDVHGTGVRAQRKRIQDLVTIVETSALDFYAGPASDQLVQVRRNPWESAAGLITGQRETLLTSRFREDGHVFIQHVNPTPLAILGLIPKFEVGG